MDSSHIKVFEWERSNWTKREFYLADTLPPIDCCSAVFWLPIVGDHVILTKNHRGRELPWGHVEEGETLEQALAREMQEETWRVLLDCKFRGYRKILNKEPIAKPNGWFYPFPYWYIPFYYCSLHEDQTHSFGIEIEDSKHFHLDEIKEMWIKMLDVIELGHTEYSKSKI